MKNYFFGRFPRKVDNKKRISIPKVFLNKLDGNMNIVLGEFRGYNQNMVAVFPNREVLDNMIDFYMNMEVDLDEVYYKRLVSSYCFDESIDSAGRIALKNHIIIPSDRMLIFVGRDELFEIWHEDDYDDYLENGGYKLI